MSHFGVMVRVPADVKEGALGDVVAKMLAPFQENNMGDCPREYMVFEDEEDACWKEFNEDSTTMIELASGKRVYPWDEQFRVPGSFGTGGGTHEAPADLKRVEVKHCERYESFEHYMKDWHGHEKRDPEKGRYGRWDNPNKKWDWWTIGGRWSGFIPLVIGGGGDLARICHVDMVRANKETNEKAATFWREWQEFAAGKKFDDFYGGPRDLALHMGLVACKNLDELTGKEWKLIPWDRQLKEGVPRFDVLAEISEADAIALYRRVNFTLRTYAWLDETGWHSPGEMGWFGMSSEDPEARAKYADDFAAWFASGNQRDWLVVVDCHI